MKLYAVKVTFYGDPGYTPEEERWELATLNQYGEFNLYTRPPERYYSGHDVHPETAISVTEI